MKKTLALILPVLFILVLFTACQGSNGQIDAGPTAATNDCCESSIPKIDNSLQKNECCGDADSPSDESSGNAATDYPTVPDCCG